MTAVDPPSLRLDQFDPTAKLARHRAHVDAVLAGQRPPPVTVEIDLTNACNHRCTFCVWADFLQTHRARLPDDLVHRLLDDLSAVGVRSVIWTGGGEPTLHRGFLGCVRHAGQVGLASGLLTNGSRLDPSWDEPLLAGLAWMRVSMAGGDAATYRAIQGRDDFATVLANLQRLLARRRTAGTGPQVGVAMIVTPENLHTLPGLAHRLAGIGADYLQVREDMFRGEALRAWWDREVVPVTSRIAADSPDGFRLLGASYVRAQRHLRYPRRCYAHFFVLAVTAEANVVFCKNTRDRPEFVLGNLREQSFADIWRTSGRSRELEAAMDPVSCATFCKNLSLNVAVQRVADGGDLPDAGPADQLAPFF